MARGDYTAIGSALTILKFVQRKPRDRYEIAQHLRVHPRSALRLLQALVEYGLLTRSTAGDRTTEYRAAVSLTQRRRL